MLLVGLITIVGWLAWSVFALSVTSELLAIVSRQRIQIHLPGLDVPQRFAAGLLISVVTMISVPLSVQADAPPDRQIVGHSRDGGTVRADHGTGRSAATRTGRGAPDCASRSRGTSACGESR